MNHEVQDARWAIGISIIATVCFNYYVLKLMSKTMSVACLYEVRVPPGFSATVEGKKILEKVRHLSFWGAVLAIVVVLASCWLLPGARKGEEIARPVLIAFAVAYIVQGVVLAGAMHSGRKRAGHYVVEDGVESEPYPRSVRSGNVAQTPLLCSRVLMIGQYILFITCGAYLALKWGSIPQRYPIQWSASLEVTRWASKSLLGVYWVLILAIVSTTVLLDVLKAIKARMFAQNRTSSRFRIIELLLLFANALIFVPMVLLSTWVPLKSAEPSVVRFAVGPVAITVLVTIIIILFISRKRTAREHMPITYRREEDLVRERKDSHYWKWNIFYYNPNDPALWVRKLLGGGISVNMARKEAWQLAWLAHFVVVFTVSMMLCGVFVLIFQ